MKHVRLTTKSFALVNARISGRLQATSADVLHGVLTQAPTVESNPPATNNGKPSGRVSRFARRDGESVDQWETRKLTMRLQQRERSATHRAKVLADMRELQLQLRIAEDDRYARAIATQRRSDIATTSDRPTTQSTAETLGASLNRTDTMPRHGASVLETLRYDYIRPASAPVRKPFRGPESIEELERTIQRLAVGVSEFYGASRYIKCAGKLVKARGSYTDLQTLTTYRCGPDVSALIPVTQHGHTYYTGDCSYWERHLGNFGKGVKSVVTRSETMFSGKDKSTSWQRGLYPDTCHLSLREVTLTDGSKAQVLHWEYATKLESHVLPVVASKPAPLTFPAPVILNRMYPAAVGYTGDTTSTSVRNVPLTMTA